MPNHGVVDELWLGISNCYTSNAGCRTRSANRPWRFWSLFYAMKLACGPWWLCLGNLIPLCFDRNIARRHLGWDFRREWRRSELRSLVPLVLSPLVRITSDSPGSGMLARWISIGVEFLGTWWRQELTVRRFWRRCFLGRILEQLEVPVLEQWCEGLDRELFASVQST